VTNRLMTDNLSLSLSHSLTLVLVHSFLDDE